MEIVFDRFLAKTRQELAEMHVGIDAGGDRHDHADRIGLAGSEALSRPVRSIARFAHGLQHALAGFRIDFRIAVQRPADCRL
ncbi:hypothetical protein D3C86_1908970 [compost metagenome]